MSDFIYSIIKKAQVLSSKITNAKPDTIIKGEIESLAWDLENAIRQVTHTLGVLPADVEKEYAVRLKVDTRFAEFRRCVDYIVKGNALDKIGWIRGLLDCDAAGEDIVKQLAIAREALEEIRQECLDDIDSGEESEFGQTVREIAEEALKKTSIVKADSCDDCGREVDG